MHHDQAVAVEVMSLPAMDDELIGQIFGAVIEGDAEVAGQAVQPFHD